MTELDWLDDDELDFDGGGWFSPAEIVARAVEALHNQPWRLRAACRELDRRLFFERVNYGPNPIALAACERCCVRSACLAFAIASGSDYGVFGGQTGAERARLRREIAQRTMPLSNGSRRPSDTI